MATKNYLVRDGFVVSQRIKNAAAPNGFFEKLFQSGETVTLDDDGYAQHAHKLELADPTERSVALAAEQKAAVAKHANNAPVVLVQTLVDALQHALSGGAAAEAPEAEPAAS